MNTNSKIAVDVVLLPPDDVMDKIIAVNEQAATKGLAWGPLKKDDFLPHLSLAMGCVEHDSLETLKSGVEAVASQFVPMTVELFEFYYAEMPDDGKMYCLRAKNIPELQKLHENLVNKLQQHFSYDCTKETLFSKSGEYVKEPDYINKFHSSYSFEAFDPHVTLRIKEEVGKDALPITFTANEVAACHAGIMTTCRKKLFTVPMGG
jgi:hypothetical protein